MDFHQLIDIEAMNPVFDIQTDKESLEQIRFSRMCGAGLFANPNDLSRIIVVASALAIYLLGALPRPFTPALICLICLLFFALMETHSRGGLIALFATMAPILWLRLGWRRSALSGLIAIPLGLGLLSDRQTDFGTDEGTGQQRIQLWMQGFAALRESPLLGIGAGQSPQLGDGLGQHNSFVECYVELGIIGGTLFLSVAYLAVWQTYCLSPSRIRFLDPNLSRVRPYIIAIAFGYAVGLLASSRNYVMPTYVIFGLAAVYQRLAGSAGARTRTQLDWLLIIRLLFLSALTVSALYVSSRASVNWLERM
jgi:O-antigen ligase